MKEKKPFIKKSLFKEITHNGLYKYEIFIIKKDGTYATAKEKLVVCELEPNYGDFIKIDKANKIKNYLENNKEKGDKE